MTIPEIKVCGITRSEDAQHAISLGASYIGFIVFEGSPRCIDPEEAKRIWTQIDQGMARSVVVDVDPDPLRLAEIEKLGFDFFQLHFPSSTDPKRVSQWSEKLAPKGFGSLPEHILPNLSPNSFYLTAIPFFRIHIALTSLGEPVKFRIGMDS